MTTQASTVTDGSALRWNRIAAIVAWLIGVLFSYMLLRSVAPSLGWFAALLLSAGAQFLLTLAERPLWRWALRRRNGKFVAFGVGVTIIDAAINAGGVYPYVPRLSQTDLGKMLIEVFSLSPTISQPTAMGIAFGIGLLVAGLSEYLWEVE